MIDTHQQWLAYTKPSPTATVRLFCFPYAGGSAGMFRTWAQSLPATVHVCPVQLPGRENRLREPPYTRLMALIETLSDSLAPALDMPFALFGHSLGGLISFELARALRRKHGLQPIHLFVSGHDAPQLQKERSPLHNLPAPDFIAELRELNGTPEEVLRHAELMQLLLPVLRADFELLETYTYSADAPLSCPISAFGGLDDPQVSRDMLEAWEAQTSEPFTLHMFPGDHFFIHSASKLLLQALANQLSPV